MRSNTQATITTKGEGRFRVRQSKAEVPWPHMKQKKEKRGEGDTGAEGGVSARTPGWESGLREAQIEGGRPKMTCERMRVVTRGRFSVMESD
jgi:hypothetical protein